MLLNAYSIFDNKALQYHPPFYASTDAAAVRQVSDLVQDLNTQVGRHPSDFVLFCVGEWNDQNGGFTPALPLIHVVDAIALVKPSAPVLPFAKEA